MIKKFIITCLFVAFASMAYAVPQQSFLVGEWDFRTGSNLDRSQTGNDGVPTNSPTMVDAEKGRTYRFIATDRYLNCGTAASLNVGTNDFTVECWLKPDRDNYPIDSNYFLAKGHLSAAGDGWNYGMFNDDIYSFFADGTDNTSFTVAANWIPNLWYHLIIAVNRPNNTVKFYSNGALLSTETLPGDIDDLDTVVPLYINGRAFNNGGAHQKGWLGCIGLVRLWSGVELSISEIENLYNDFLTTPGQIEPPIGNFQYDEPNDLSVSGLVGAWNMRQQGGQVLDISTNNIHGNFVGVPMDREGVFGRSLSFSSSGSMVDLTREPFNADNDFSISLWANANDITTFQNLYSHYEEVDTLDPAIGIEATGGTYKVRIRNQAGVDTQVTCSASTNTWFHVVAVQENNVLTFYCNGVNEGSDTFTGSRIDATTFTIGARDFGSGTSNSFDGIIDEVRTYDRALTSTEVKNLYLEGATQVLINEEWEANGADGLSVIPKGWRARSGTHAINEVASSDSVLPFISRGYKYSDILTAGRITTPSENAYCTWEFDIYKDTDASNYSFFPVSTNGGGAGTGIGYNVQITSTESLKLIEQSPATTTLFETAASYVSIQTWYRLRLTRTFDGEFTLFIKGGAFGNNFTTVDVSGGSGSNPVTDTTHTTSACIVKSANEGDRLGTVLIKRGVE